MNLISHLKGATPLSQGTKDSLHWDPDEGDYSVKSGYATLHQLENHDWEHWREAWKIEILPKIKVFMWPLLKGKIITVDNLNKKGYEGHSRCAMCQMSEESIQHLFVGCPFARDCWLLLVRPLEFCSQQSMSLHELLSTWKKKKVSIYF